MRPVFAVLLAAAAACTSAHSDDLPDATVLVAADPCDACAPDELCVQRFDGTCGLDTTCVPRDSDCPSPSLTDPECSPACGRAYCPAPYTCTEREGCDGPAPSPAAFTCYGP